MTEHFTIALDVGQTFIRSALLDEQGHILTDSFSIFSSKFSKSNDDFLNHLVKIIKFNINSILHLDFDIHHIGFSVSGYLTSRGDELSVIEKELRKKLEEVPSIRAKLNSDYQFHIEQEANLFAIGEHVLRTPECKNKRVLYLIIGSKLSLTFMENGCCTNKQLNTFRNQLFLEGKVEDYISSQGIIDISNSLGFEDSKLSPKEIAKMAIDNDLKALEVYKQFGHNLGLALKGTIDSLLPDEIIVGGNIALSYPLFKNSFEETFNQPSVQVHPTEYTSVYIFFWYFRTC